MTKCLRLVLSMIMQTSPLMKSEMTAVGFEPTPLRTGAWSQRLRPLGQTVGIKNNHDVASSDCVEYIVRYRDSMTSKEASSRDSNSRRIKHDSCGI